MPAEFLMSLELPGIPFIIVAIAETLGIYEMLLLYPRRFSAPAAVLLFPLVLAGQVYLRCYALSVKVMPEFYLSMAVNVAYMLLCTALLCKGDIWTLLHAGMLSFILAETMAAIGWPVLKWVSMQHSFSGWFELAMACGNMIFLQLLSAFMIRRSQFPIHSSPAMTVQIILLALLAFLLSNSLFSLTHISSGRELADSVSLSDTAAAVARSYCITRAAVDLCALALVYIQLLDEKRKGMEQESAAINTLVETQYKQYQEYKESVEHIARQCHDLKHQLAVLRDTRHQEALNREMDRMETMIDRYESATNTGNAVLDILLTQKLIYCREHDIQMTYTADGRLLGEMQTADICALFGNLLDNAIEHVQTLPLLEDRQIILSVQSRGGLLAVKAENRCDRISVRLGELPATTKEDRGSHGYGCRSVQHIAQSYGGTAEFRTEDCWFTASVLLPLARSFEEVSSDHIVQ